MSISHAAPLRGPVSLSLPFSPQCAAQVRRALGGWLAYQGASRTVVDDALLVATELVSNAIRHASPYGDATLQVHWRREGDDLVLSVQDGGPGRPRPVQAPPEAESGRGLAIVEALSRHWRVEPLDSGKVVHVHLALQ